MNLQSMEEGLQKTRLLVNIIDSKKKKEGNPCICPICTIIEENTKQAKVMMRFFAKANVILGYTDNVRDSLNQF